MNIILQFLNDKAQSIDYNDLSELIENHPPEKTIKLIEMWTTEFTENHTVTKN